MVDLSKLWPELRSLLELALAWLSGWVTKGLKTRADEAQTKSDALERAGKAAAESRRRSLPDKLRRLEQRRMRDL